MTAPLRDMTNELSWERPHLLLLGAGASKAAFLSGDAKGHELPVMANLVQVCSLSSLLHDAGLHDGHDDFESLYSDLCDKPEYGDLKQKVEGLIWSYFRRLEQPPAPTIYDLLVLSLRKKDVIATFNWDPFLVQSLVRTAHIHRGEAPRPLFLHGNVEIAYCPKCTKPTPVGRLHSVCRHCSNEFVPSTLLFPVRKKDYTTDHSIESAWADMKTGLHSAYMWTIFGYGAPKSDVDAIKLMKSAWGSKYDRNLEQLEIIDVKEEDELQATWDDFIHTHHYDTWKDIGNSRLLRHPRRGCEAFWSMSMDLRIPEERPVHPRMDWTELESVLGPLVDAEKGVLTHHRDKKPVR
ncbi:MAG: hypothetical protein JSS66_11065 [Armatimonadetes bacterium]|nr:hypothetical protein [Armatimonadota bacterium]